MGFDDEDIARFDVPMFYDLSLVKALDPGQTFHLGDTLGYTITISNQGNVPSGLFNVQDALPDGLTFVSASDGATAVGNLVTWTNLPSLSPGAAMTVSIRARLDDVNESSYTNIAEIVADGSGWYSTPVIGFPMSTRHQLFRPAISTSQKTTARWHHLRLH